MMKTELVSYLFLSYLTFLVSGTPQFTTCPSSVCLSQPVTYVCNSGAATLIWIVLDTNGDRVGTPVQYSEFVSAPNSIGSQFSTVLINNTNPLGANIAFTPTLNISNYTVQCGDGSVDNIVNCSIMIADVPIAAHANSPSFGALGSNRFEFFWSPQTDNPQACFSHYILVITSEVDNINYTTTDTRLRLPVSSANNTLYTYTVLTVDTGGRYSESPMYHSYIPNVPLSVTNLMLTQTDYRNDTNETVNITVSWNEPPSSPRPPVLQYHINYNVSDVLQNITVPAGTTSRTLSGFTVGSVYTVGVAAINALGTGTTASATITILATTTEIPSASTSVSSSLTSGISSTPSITPSSTPTEPTSTSTLGAGAIAGIAIAIILLIAVVVISVIVVCYCMMKNKDKPESSVAPQNVEAYNYTQVEPSAKLSSSKRQAPPKPPKSSPPEEPVIYTAVQKSGASHDAPQGGTTYADLDHGSLSSGKRNQKPNETNQVMYSAVSHNGSR